MTKSFFSEFLKCYKSYQGYATTSACAGFLPFQLSAILDLGNQADFWQQNSVYGLIFPEFMFIYLSNFFVQFRCSYKHEIMISNEIIVSFLRYPVKLILWIRAILAT